MYVPRNFRAIQKPSGIHRSAKGVGASIFEHEVRPIFSAIFRRAILKTHASGRTTIKEKHFIAAFDEVFNGVSDEKQSMATDMITAATSA